MSRIARRRHRFQGERYPSELRNVNQSRCDVNYYLYEKIIKTSTRKAERKAATGLDFDAIAEFPGNRKEQQ